MKNNFFFSGYHYKLPDEQPSTASWGGDSDPSHEVWDINRHDTNQWIFHRDFVHGCLFRSRKKQYVLLMGQKSGELNSSRQDQNIPILTKLQPTSARISGCWTKSTCCVTILVPTYQAMFPIFFLPTVLFSSGKGSSFLRRKVAAKSTICLG